MKDGEDRGRKEKVWGVDIKRGDGTRHEGTSLGITAG